MNKKTQKHTFEDELVTLTGTYAELMLAFSIAYYNVLPHQWNDWWLTFQRGHFPMVMTENEMGVFTDFAAVFAHRQAHTATCGTSYRSNLDVAVAVHSPQNKIVKQFGREKEVTGENSKGCVVTLSKGAVVEVEKRVWSTDVWRAMTSAVNTKSDTVMHQVLMQDMATFYKKGYVLHATECYIDGKRVPTKAEVDDGALPLLEFVLALLALFHVFSDGCARQYAGRKNYLKVAEFFTLMGLIMLQHTAQAHCFKGVWDGFGKDPKQGARDAVRRHKHTLPTTRPWFKWCVENMPRPARKEKKRGEEHPDGLDRRCLVPTGTCGFTTRARCGMGKHSMRSSCPSQSPILT
jgi:hypothetical protein